MVFGNYVYFEATTNWEFQTATSRGKTIAKNGLNNNENFQSLAREQSTYAAVKKIQTIQIFVCLLRKIVRSVFFSFFFCRTLFSSNFVQCWLLKVVVMMKGGVQLPERSSRR